MKRKQRGSVKLYKNKTQHLVCTARINGVSAKLLIDTGASSSCLNKTFQEQFALEIEGQPFEAAGASEGKMQAIYSKASSLHLGRFNTGKHSFVLLDMSHINTTLKNQGVAPIEGILGADFFFERKAQIDYQNRRLYFNSK
ncbi:MAG: aspartyl protease family protein [Flavobacteriaceae bacterium]